VNECAAPATAGALLVDKPPGPTSHDIVAVVRRALKQSRVGHTGTLDPLATGLLVMLVGPATRMAQFLAADEKEYVADVRLGIATPTYDAQSLSDAVRSPMSDVRVPMGAELDSVLDQFRGSFLQMPPPFSAKKVAGVAAYEKARKNQPVDLKPVPVTVRTLEVLDTSTIGHRSSGIGSGGSSGGGLVRLRVAATAGFYVRSLAHDIGQALGCGAHLEALRRTRVGRFRVEDALTLDGLEKRGADALIPLNQLLGEMPAATLTAEGARRATHGNAIGPSCLAGEPGVWQPGHVRLLDASGQLLAVAERRGDGLLHPLVVLG
jgi:tRNA pseudouridine55 synthase